MSIKVSFVMNVLNGEPFIEYQLRSIYPFAHEIIITEGAYSKFAHGATPDGHSTDNTITIIKNFPDPAHKIHLIEHTGFWDDRCEMCNGFMASVTGDILWQVDADEFYHPWAYEYIITLFENDKELDLVSFRVKDFFASLNYEVVGATAITNLRDVRRVHRFQIGDRWITQRPPTLVDSRGILKPIRKEITAEKIHKLGIFIFHPTTLLEKQTFDKFKYYRQMWKGIEQSDSWLYDTWYHFRNPLRLAGFTEYASWIEVYTDSVPPLLSDMIADIQMGKYPDIKLRDNADIELYLHQSSYHQDVLIARNLNDCLSNISNKKYRAAIPKFWFVFSHFICEPTRLTYRHCMVLAFSFIWDQSKFLLGGIIRKIVNRVYGYKRI